MPLAACPEWQRLSVNGSNLRIAAEEKRVDQVFDNIAESRFEFALAGGMAIIAYRIEGERIVLVHTEVPRVLSGQGVGSRLAKGAFELIRTSGRKAVLGCGFIRGWIVKHPEYHDIVDG